MTSLGFVFEVASRHAAAMQALDPSFAAGWSFDL
jgi:hypothetical protein